MHSTHDTHDTHNTRIAHARTHMRNAHPKAAVGLVDLSLALSSLDRPSHPIHAAS